MASRRKIFDFSSHHFIKKVNWPPESVAPMIFSGFNPLPNPLGRSSVALLFLGAGSDFSGIDFRFFSSV